MAGDDDGDLSRLAEQERSYTRSWLAIGLGTLVGMIGYTSMLVAIVSSQSDTPDVAGPAFALGFALAPITFIVVAFVSGHWRASTAVLKSMGLWLLIALPLGLVNPVVGLSAGYGVGGAVSLKQRDSDRLQTRLWAAVLVALYCFGLLLVFPPLGVLTGGLAPLPALGLADYYTANRRPKEA